MKNISWLHQKIHWVPEVEAQICMNHCVCFDHCECFEAIKRWLRFCIKKDAFVENHSETNEQFYTATHWFEMPPRNSSNWSIFFPSKNHEILSILCFYLRLKEHLKWRSWMKLISISLKPYFVYRRRPDFLISLLKNNCKRSSRPRKCSGNSICKLFRFPLKYFRNEAQVKGNGVRRKRLMMKINNIIIVKISFKLFSWLLLVLMCFSCLR